MGPSDCLKTRAGQHFRGGNNRCRTLTMALLRNIGRVVLSAFMENVDITKERYAYHNIRERCVCVISKIPDIFIINISTGSLQRACCQILFSGTFTGASEGRRVEIKLGPKWGQLPAETKDI